MASKNYNRYDKLEFIHYDDIDEYDNPTVLRRFFYTDDDKFKEGRLEVLDNNKYPSLLRYKDSSGRIFRVINGFDSNYIDYAMVDDRGKLSFNMDGVYYKALIDSPVTSNNIGEYLRDNYGHFYSEVGINKIISTSKTFEHKSGTIFEITQLLDSIGVNEELPNTNKFELSYVVKSYIDGKVYISKAIPNKSLGASQAIVKIKEDELIKEIMVNISFPTITPGV